MNLRTFKWIDETAKSKHVILHTNKAGDLKLLPFDLELKASATLLELERDNPEDDIVLVGEDSVAQITDEVGFDPAVGQGREDSVFDP